MAGGRLIRAVAEVNTTRRPEHDITLRVAVLVAVMAGALAVLFAGAAPLGESTAIVLVMPLAFLWSHRRRNDSNWAAKIVISVLAVAVLIRFFDGLSGITTVDDARLPLSVLFLEIQVLHAFDLPQRRDLMFGLVSSLALLGLALATGPGAWMFVLFAVHLSASAVALHRHGRSRAQEWAEDGVVGPPLSSVEVRLVSCDITDKKGHKYLASDKLHLGKPCRGRGEIQMRGPPGVTGLGSICTPSKG